MSTQLLFCNVRVLNCIFHKVCVYFASMFYLKTSLFYAIENAFNCSGMESHVKSHIKNLNYVSRASFNAT